MQAVRTSYHVAIIGGGLAGLAAAIELGRKGHSVVLFEKGSYPFHKVCGEYVSMESWKYLERLGVPLADMQLPFLQQLLLTAPDGRSFSTSLPLGGFGISRYLLDTTLARLAGEAGVQVLQGTKVEEVSFREGFVIRARSSHTGQLEVTARVCLAAYGKRSNLDIKWSRRFLLGGSRRLPNYVGVKYHLQVPWESGVIGLHNFEGGYCGISKIEGGQYCLCYMVEAGHLKDCNNDIQELQRRVLSQNPKLKALFEQACVAEGFPVVISQINYGPKTQVENHVLMIGDAAGMITPLCGNGMSMALHTGKMASGLVTRYLEGQFSRAQLEAAYQRQWRRRFSRRLRTGRLLQRFFGSGKRSTALVWLLQKLPFLANPLIRLTHGKPF